MTTQEAISLRLYQFRDQVLEGVSSSKAISEVVSFIESRKYRQILRRGGVAKLLSVSERQVDKWRKEEAIPEHYRGKVPFFYSDEILDWHERFIAGIHHA